MLGGRHEGYPAGVRTLPTALLACVFAVPASPALAAQPSSPPAQQDWVRGLQWQISSLRLPEVHGRATGAGMVVAVIDSGVDPTHQDLTGQVLHGPDAKANTDIDGRGTGLAGLIVGHGHSTASPAPASASILSTMDPEAAGILGVAPSAKILPISFAPNAGETGDPNELATGVELAVNRGARIICIGRGVQPSERLQFAMDVAVEKGVLIVAADSTTWPASFPGVLTSIPADRSGAVRVAPASGRTTGIVVPGVELVTTDRGNGYRIADSSAGAAILAGAAAVVWSANPTASATEVTQWLRGTAVDRGPTGPDTQFGVGDLNLVAALDAGVPRPSRSPSASPTATAKPVIGSALVDSGDWRRWLAILPIVLFFAALALWAYFTARRSRG